MQNVVIDETYFEGAVSIEKQDGWLQPWRLDINQRELYISPGESLLGRAAESSGVRLRFETDATRIDLRSAPLELDALDTHTLDLTVDGDVVVSVPLHQGAESTTFEGLPDGTKIVELWLPHTMPIRLRSMGVNDGATCRVVPDSRPKWVTYGSSLTHCRRAHGSARTWPGVVAREKQWNLTSLGFGGNCCLEPMIGMTIRKLPADLITLKLGINCIGGSLSPRTFAAAVTGLVQIIREKHPKTPIALISPIGYPPNETTPNLLAYTIEGMRADIEEVHRRLCERGDKNLTYFNGLNLFNLEEIAEYTEDQCHPNGDGIELMGRHFIDRIAPHLPV